MRPPTALVVPTVFSLTNGFNLLTLAPVVPAPFTGKLTGSNGALSGTLNKNATVSGVLLQDAAFGDRVGAGLIQFPTVRVPAVKGSFETGGFLLENTVAE